MQFADRVSLDDKYSVDSGRIFVTGTQALVRLPLMQRRLDRAAGHNTAGYVTGYRGSPLGSVDQAFQSAKRFAEADDIHFQPGLNEDLAATAVLGTQQIGLAGDATCDGVFAMWYGKGPGVDRSGDAFRHGNLAGSAPLGGVLLLAGDDHTCKSSTTSHQSEYALMDAMIPVLNPAGIEDILEMGLYGWALSRYAGCWSAMKLVAEIVDSSMSVAASPDRLPIVSPSDFAMPTAGLGIRWPDTPQEQERRLHTLKIPAALAFARANRIDRVVLGGTRRRFGIVTTGKSYLDVRQALDEMGIDEVRAEALGLAIYKVGMSWPLEPEGLTAFAAGLEALLVVEEKRPLIEMQVKDVLFALPADRRPEVFGKRDAENRLILPAHDDLTPLQIARAIAARILPWLDDEEMIRRIGRRLAEVDADTLARLAPVHRSAYFCSGCPHSTSTRVPKGSRALAGIGCHWMAQAMDRDTDTYTHMGAEGANWIGQAPFVSTPHIFQNIGDGTYFHSGVLAIRAAIAAKVNITYKVLFNDAVAMTGGQAHDGTLTPQTITHQVRAEGVARIAVVTDDPAKYADQPSFAVGSTIHHRDDLDAVQRLLREVPGVSVLVYDQMCAAEKRRRRKRGTLREPERRVIINELVCEGCGDCSAKSNCLSVVPMETPFGTKRAIDQSSCNKDFSCINGFCPSFVTVEGGALRKPQSEALESLLELELPEVAVPTLDRPYSILVAGVGGTGVITIGSILAMAAHLEGKGCSTLDMAGMAQKGGQVTAHLRFARDPLQLHAPRITPGSADVVLGCDLVVASGIEALSVISSGRTAVVLNVEETITGNFIRDPDFRIPVERLIGLLREAAGDTRVTTINASPIARMLLGDSIGANLFMVGFAFQRGLIPVTEQSIARAIELNGTAVAMNRSAFRLGRATAVHPEKVDAALFGASPGYEPVAETLDEQVARREAFLTAYQDAPYATAYARFISTVREREQATTGRQGPLSEAVARNLFRLMAYKDEYEVARLHSDKAFRDQLERTFSGTYNLRFHLAPPIASRRDPITGEPRKRAFGGWLMAVFRILAAMRRLRGTPLDPFGRSADRRTERQLIDKYRSTIERVLENLGSHNLEGAVQLAHLPEDIRGYGPVKERNLVRVQPRWEQLESEFLASSPALDPRHRQGEA